MAQAMATSSTEVPLSSEDHVIIVAFHLPLRLERNPTGGYVIEWDDERGISGEGMQLPAHCTYIGCSSPRRAEPGTVAAKKHGIQKCG